MDTSSDASTRNDIIEIVSANPVAVLVDEKAYSEFYQRVKAEVDGHVPDLTTAKGRGEIKALAYKVTRSKTAIDDAGKKLNEEARAKINAVDAQRRKIREELDALAEEVRRPLTEWEDAEKARIATVKQTRESVIGLGNSSPQDGTQEIRDRLMALAEIELDADVLREEYDEIAAQKQESHDYLTAHLARAEKAEADAAELLRLRAEAEARAADEREARERAERERAEKEAAELAAAADRERQERAEQEAKARADRAAEEARQAEIAKANAERERIEREAAERVAKAEAEAKRVRDEEAARQAQIEQTRREEEARQRDREHRGKVMKAAKEAIMECGADEETAKKIVLAIFAENIPNVRGYF